MELDIFIPSLNLGFEFQGIQHYVNTNFHGRDQIKQSNRDQSKRDACEKIGITLIDVPFWWIDIGSDGKTFQEKIVQIIREARGELQV